MACGGSCCGSGQAGATPAKPVSQEASTVRVSMSALRENSSGPSISCCGIESLSREENGCSSMQEDSENSTPQSCCSSKPSKDTLSESKCSPQKKRAGGCHAKELLASPGIATNLTNTRGTSCDVQPAPAPTSAGCCTNGTEKQGCCASSKKVDTTINAFEVPPDVNEFIDTEKSGAGKEHVVLSISGMTCTGCETKLQRTLATLPYVSKLRTSLILARAEFDIDNTTATVEDVVKHLSRTTEFKCELISTKGSSLDLICDGPSAAFADGEWPLGVLKIQPTDTNTIHVDYDANVIGARDLVESGWHSPMQLAPLRPDPSLDAGNRHVWHMGLLTLLSACLTIPVLVMAWAPLPDCEIAFSSASLALATIVQVCVAGPFYPKATKALVFSRVIEMDLLIVLSTTAAYVFSVVAFGYMISGQPLSTGEFFETSTLLVTLIMVGRWVASLARQKAAESISIRSLQTPTAILTNDKSPDEEIDARLLQYGDSFKVAPDTQIPTDGTVTAGSSEVDESMLTGESRPMEKNAGSSVIAGSINGSSMLTVRLTCLPGDNTITTIASMVDEAKLSKPRIQDIADTVASYFVPAVVVLTIITLVIWVAIGIIVRKQSGSDATIEAITYAITVLIVSCPCAIGLAVPMVIVIASGMAARRGVVFKSAASIEVAYKTTDVVFDKTGTLTLGQLAVVEEAILHRDPELSQSLLLGLLSNIKHPVSVAVVAHLIGQDVTATAIQDAKVVTGKGVQGIWQGKTLRAGNSRWLDLTAQPEVQSLLFRGLTVFCFTVDSDVVAIYGLQDTLRPDAASTISQLQQRGIATHILSGDDDGAVQSVASQLAIPSNHVRSRCSPADKRSYIETLQNRPKSSKQRKPIVVFIGDGTNDAVALAQATVGVHMSSGTDIAQSAADVVLMRSDLSGILTLLAISRKAMHRVAFNFGWSFVYNLFAILLGAGAFVNARIPPELAGLGELVSVLPVIAAAVLLRWSRV